MSQKQSSFRVEPCANGLRVLGVTSPKRVLSLPEEIEGTPVAEIAPKAFEGDDALEAISLPPTLRKIGERAFASAPKLKEISLPDGLESLGDEAFADDPALLAATLHAGIKEMGHRVFRNDPELQIKLPDFTSSPEAWPMDWNVDKNEVIYGFVTLVNVNKMYPHHVQAVFNMNLVVKKHDFVVLVGPSGCGKSTTLRMIAGLEDISSGSLYIDGNFCNETQPKDRGIAMVFQSYALYPHMTVRENMAFGLKMRKTPSKEIDKRVEEAAEILGLTEYLERKPKALSGGQRQRVALGRAIVRNAKVFLMDEPLSNLDAKLRVQMRADLIMLHEKVGATTIYVTHDQTEAMTMATRIVVMRAGRVQQIGTPKEIYGHPANRFVAGFIGSPAMNFLPANCRGGELELSDGHRIELDEEKKELLSAYAGKPITLGIRPEGIQLDESGTEVEVEVAELLGAETLLHFHIGQDKVVAKVQTEGGKEIHAHDKVKIRFPLSRLCFFDPESQLSVQDGSLCVDKTLPEEFHGKRIDTKGVTLTSPSGKVIKVKASPDDLDLTIDKDLTKVELENISLKLGEEFVQTTKSYRVYFSARLVNKILKAAEKTGPNCRLGVY